MNYEIEYISELNGTAVEFGEREYLEYYQDLNGLSSAVWSTDATVDGFLKEASSLISDLHDGKKAAVRLMGAESLELLDAHDVTKFLQNNLGRVAFCRVDFGHHSIIWTNEQRDDANEQNANDAEAGMIFHSYDTGLANVMIERTGTSTVRASVTEVLPRLVATIKTNMKEKENEA